MAGRDLTIERVSCLEHVVFVQDEEGRRVVDKIARVKGVVARGATDRSVKKAVEHLKQWDSADDVGECELLAATNPGESRTTEGEYVLTWHLGLGYVSLDRLTVRRPMAPCGCFPHVTYMTGFGFHCETEDQGYCNFECPHDDNEESA